MVAVLNNISSALQLFSSSALQLFSSSALQRPDAGAALRTSACAAFAAARMASSTRFGWESIGTWLLSSSYVVAPMRLAKKRSRSGCTVWSFLPTMYQLGFEDRKSTRLNSSHSQISYAVFCL